MRDRPKVYPMLHLDALLRGAKTNPGTFLAVIRPFSVVAVESFVRVRGRILWRFAILPDGVAAHGKLSAFGVFQFAHFPRDDR